MPPLLSRLFFRDATTDPTHYTNTSMAIYCGKEQVALAPAPPE